MPNPMNPRRMMGVVMALAIAALVVVWINSGRTVLPEKPQRVGGEESKQQSTPEVSGSNEAGGAGAMVSPMPARVFVAPPQLPPPPPPPPPRVTGTPVAVTSLKEKPAADSASQAEGRIAEEAVQNAVRKYGGMFGGNPVGTNAEITAALNGENPGHARFLEGMPGSKIDSNGEMVDAWGTPYFFHQLSATDMEIHSAGPDRIMWTNDDIVLK